MGVSGFDNTGQVQGVLFDGEDREKQSQADAVADQIQGTVRNGALRRGISLGGDSPRAL